MTAPTHYMLKDGTVLCRMSYQNMMSTDSWPNVDCRICLHIRTSRAIDGVFMSEGDRILITGQKPAWWRFRARRRWARRRGSKENGIYTISHTSSYGDSASLRGAAQQHHEAQDGEGGWVMQNSGGRWSLTEDDWRLVKEALLQLQIEIEDDPDEFLPGAEDRLQATLSKIDVQGRVEGIFHELE